MGSGFRGSLLAAVAVGIILCLDNVKGVDAGKNYTSTVEICDMITMSGLERNYREDCIAREMPTGVLIELQRNGEEFKEYNQCKSYILLPGENMWSREARGFLYLFALLYCFLGIAIVADVFMNAIETITSKKVEVILKDPNTGRDVRIMQDVWNPTIANLTLMALGSSAPEILLSVIGVVTALGEEADQLGPATIVGSAAFNLLCISAVCIIAPAPGMRKVEQMGVFNITAFFSVWAYVWLLIIIDFSSPEVIETWEALVTFLQFPLLVGLAYGQDRGWNFSKQTQMTPEEAAQIRDQEEEHKNTLKYRMNAVRMITGGARLKLPNKNGVKEIAKDEEVAPTADPKALMSDPYAIVRYNNVVKKTHWKVKNLNPRWLEKFDFKHNPDATSLKIDVYDHDELSADDFMGCATVDLSELKPGLAVERWCDLCAKSGQRDQARGKVFVKLMVMDDSKTLQVSVVEGKSLIGLEKASKLDDLTRAAGDRMRAARKKFALTWDKVGADYKAQFQAALTFSGPVDDDGNELPPTGVDLLMHFLTVFWKVFFALIPPAEYYGGKLAFGVALIFIGIVTAIVGEIAGLFGCVVGLDEGVTAITFVALGTSLPDTFASKLAAVNEPTADNAVGNVTGSNSVNVFLGIGLPWLIGAVYADLTGTKFVARSGGFGLSVLTFCILATIFLGLLYYRRYSVGAELGGPIGFAKVCGGIAVLFWFIYVVVSSMRMYDHIGDIWSISGPAQPPPPPPWHARIGGYGGTTYAKAQG